MNIQSTLFGTMQHTLTPPAPDFELSEQAPSLLDQMDRFTDRDLMVARASKAFAYITAFLNGPAEQTDDLVESLSNSELIAGVSRAGNDGLVLAVASAAVVEALTAGRQTPVEALEHAADLLAARYLLP